MRFRGGEYPYAGHFALACGRGLALCHCGAGAMVSFGASGDVGWRLEYSRVGMDGVVSGWGRVIDLLIVARYVDRTPTVRARRGLLAGPQSVTFDGIVYPQASN